MTNSEYGKLEHVLLRRPDYAFGSDEKIDREWEKLNYLSKPELAKAVREYKTLVDLITSGGAKVSFQETTSDQLSLDSLYVRDASVSTDHGMILTNMGKEARNFEPELQQRLFEELGVPILGKIETPGKLEGGDVAWINENLLAVGRGYRTNAEGIRQLQELIKEFAEIVEVQLPHFRGPSDVFHLMSIFSPVDKDVAVVYSPLMPVSFRELLLDLNFRLVEVPEEEFDSLGCNVLAIRPSRCIIAKGNPVTTRLLKEAGTSVFEYAAEEISLKGCGGPTCLTRPIRRSK